MMTKNKTAAKKTEDQSVVYKVPAAFVLMIVVIYAFWKLGGYYSTVEGFTALYPMFCVQRYVFLALTAAELVLCVLLKNGLARTICRYWLAAFALPYLPARRAAAQPAGLQDTNKPLGVCMALAGAARRPAAQEPTLRASRRRASPAAGRQTARQTPKGRAPPPGAMFSSRGRPSLQFAARGCTIRIFRAACPNIRGGRRCYERGTP